MNYPISEPKPPNQYPSEMPRPYHRPWGIMTAMWVIVFLLVWSLFGSPTQSTLTVPDAKPRAVTARGDLADDEKVTIEIFERSSPAVVFITNIAYQRVSPFNLNVSKVPAGSGTGIIFDRSGHIVTNMHVIYGARELAVTLADQVTYEAAVVGYDEDKDLAVLKIDVPATKITPISVGTSHDLKVGQKVFAIGNPFGWDHTLTTGVISALGREINSLVEGRTIRDVIQTDAAINPGNSGGPLLDSAGRLIGVNTQIASPSGASVGIGFAVPIDIVNRVVTQIIKFGQVIKPGLGVNLMPDHIARALRLEGILLQSVPDKSAAAAAGLRGTILDRRGVKQLGDVLISIGDASVTNRNDLLNELDKYEVGNKVNITYVRDGNRLNTSVTLQRVN